MFEDLFDKVKNKSLETKSKDITNVIGEIFNTSGVELKDRIKQARTEEDLYNIIINNYYDTIEIILYNNDIYKLFINNIQFLVVLIRATNNIGKLSDTYVIKLNYLCCKYLAKDRIKSNNNQILSLLYNLSRITVMDKFDRLIALGIPEYMVTNITMYSKSSENQIEASHRVNVMIIRSMEDVVFSVQNLMYVYQIVFDRITPLFISVMLNTKLENNNQLPKKTIYDNILTAVLNILEGMGVNKIYYVLREYIIQFTEKKQFESNVQPRIELKNLNSTQYPNILEAYNIIQNEDE